MTVIDLAEARRRRDEHRERIQAATQWAFEVLPWHCSIFSDEFNIRWNHLASSEQAEVAAKVERMVGEYQEVATAPTLDYDEVMGRLIGREEWWTRVASWSYLRGPDADFQSDEFIKHFSQISRSEMIMGLIHTRRIRNVMK